MRAHLLRSGLLLFSLLPLIPAADPPAQVQAREQGKPAMTTLWNLVAPPPAPAAATTGVVISAVSLGSTPVALYQRMELLVSLSAAIALPYETDPTLGGLDLSATFTDPTGGVWTVPGFYDGATIPGQWKIRFTPSIASASVPWQVSINARGADGTSTWQGSFGCSGSLRSAAAKGFVRISGGGLRFSGASTWFYGLGHNTGWQSMVETPAIATMASQGENLLSFWMAEPWVRQIDDGSGQQVLPARAPLENAAAGVGNYNQAACAYIDSVVADAEAAGVYLLPSLWAHDEAQDAAAPWGNGSWDNNAYRSVCASPADFFVTSASMPTPSWHYQLNRYRYIAARWASSTAIIGWVGLVEIDGTAGSQSSNGPTWCSAVRAALAQWDPYRHGTSSTGTTYPLVVSKSDSASGDATTWGRFLDLVECDSYLSQSSNYGVAATIASDTTTLRQAGKPAFNGEFGAAIPTPPTSDPSQPTHLRNGVMAGLATGAVLSPLLWTDGGQFPLVVANGTLAAQYTAISHFAAGLSDLGDPSLVRATLGYSNSALRGWGQCRASPANWGFVWTQASKLINTISKPTLTIGHLASGSYQVVWYDASAGSIVRTLTSSTATVSIGGSRSTGLSLSIPSAAVGDLAVRFTSDVSAQLPMGSLTLVQTRDVAVASGDPSALATGPSVNGSSATSSGSGGACGVGGGVSVMLLALGARLRRRDRKA